VGRLSSTFLENRKKKESSPKLAPANSRFFKKNLLGTKIQKRAFYGIYPVTLPIRDINISVTLAACYYPHSSLK